MTRHWSSIFECLLYKHGRVLVRIRIPVMACEGKQTMVVLGLRQWVYTSEVST